jgi:hypothetical protein
MKVVINTQYRENYGEPGSPHWKFKGGSVYVIPNTAVISREEREELRNLVEYSNEMSEEYISSTHIVGDDEVVCDEWEAPIVLVKGENGRWTASVVRVNDGQFREEIATKTETWTMLPESGREDYTAIYTMVEGKILNEEGLIQFYNLKG